jgi:hypothetical protein
MYDRIMAGLTRLTIHKPSTNGSKSPSTSLRQVSILVSSNTPSEILPIESQSFSAQTELEEKFTALEVSFQIIFEVNFTVLSI